MNGSAKTSSRPQSGRAGAPATRSPRKNAAPSAVERRAATKAAGAPATSKDELRARVEKLERANATLRMKNKELQLAAVEAAEHIDALTLQLASLERKADRQARAEAPAEAGPQREAARPARGRRKARTEGTEGESESETMGSELNTSEHLGL